MWRGCVRWLDIQVVEMAQYSGRYGGVGAPVGLTVFKTAGGSLGAVPGGFDSHTPLPRTFAIVFVISVINTMVLRNLQNYASYFRLQNYASQQIFKNSRYLSGHRNF